MQLAWLSRPRGASWLQIASALAELIEPELLGTTIREVPGGGRKNLERLRAGEAHLATSVTHLAQAAIYGDPSLGEASMESLRALGQGWMRIPFHVVHATEHGPSDLRTALKGPQLRIGVPRRSTSDELTFRRVLEVCATSYDEIRANGGLVAYDDYDVLANRFRSGEIDYFFGATAAPSNAIQRMVTGTRTAELLPITGGLAGELIAAGWSSGVIAASTYPSIQSDDVHTVEMSSILLTATALPDPIANAITKSLLTRAEDMRQIHPSLARFERLVNDSTRVALHHNAYRE